MSKGKSGFLYLAVANDFKPNKYRIGQTLKLETEITVDLCREYPDYSIEIIRYVYVKDCDAAEQELRAKLQSKLIRGEWFTLSPMALGNIEQEMLNLSYGKPHIPNYLDLLFPVALFLLGWVGFSFFNSDSSTSQPSTSQPSNIIRSNKVQ
jgi:hypothetical protein